MTKKIKLSQLSPNTGQHKRRNQMKEGRLEIVAQLYRRGYSIRAIRAEVMRRLSLATYSISTVHFDIKSLLAEWRESRLQDMDDAVQLELTRIDDTVRELWEQWEKSKEDYVKTNRKRKGAPVRNANQVNNSGGEAGIRTYSVEEQTLNVVGLGNPAYISEIRQQLAERRKLLGLYAPERRGVVLSELDLSLLTPEQRAELLRIGEQVLNGKTG